MSEFTSLVILTVILKTVSCENIIINIRGDVTAVYYYKQIVTDQNVAEKLMNNLFNGTSSSFSMKYSSEVMPDVATSITFLKTDNDSTFFKCWSLPSIQSVTCERQTMNQCKLTLSNESCCSNRNAFLWNTSSEFLYSHEIRNFTVNCGNQTNHKFLFVYDLVQTPTSSTTPLIASTLEQSSKQTEEIENNCTGLIIGLIVSLSAVVVLAVTLVIIGVTILKKRKKLKNQPCNKGNDLNLNDNNRNQDNGNTQDPTSNHNNNIPHVRHFSDITTDVSKSRNHGQHYETDFYLDVIDTNIPYNVTSYENVQQLSSGYVNTDLEEEKNKGARTSLKTATSGVKQVNTEIGPKETQSPFQSENMSGAIIMDKTYQDVNEYDSLAQDGEPPQLYSRLVG